MSCLYYLRRSATHGLPLAALFLMAVRPGDAADIRLTRIAMLPLPERTTIVVELSAPVSRVEEIQTDQTTLVLEAGPISPGVQGRELKPGAPSPLVSAVNIGSTVRADGSSYLRLSITTQIPAVHQRRTAGSRLYVDLLRIPEPSAGSPPTEPASRAAAPRPAAPRAAAPPEAALAAASTRAEVGVRAERRPAVPPTQPQAPSPEPKSTVPASSVDVAYQAFESTTRRRARELAAVPDVKGLLRLREEVEQRGKKLGKQRADLVEQLMVEVVRYTDEARARQLERDRRAFLKEQ
jgi:hypothetical protein